MRTRNTEFRLIRGGFVLALWAVTFGLQTGRAWPQMVHIQSPLAVSGTGYYEQTGVGWGYDHGNFHFSWPGGNALPPFGGYDPAADARLGLQFAGPQGGRGRFNLTMGQGSTRTNTMGSSMLTLPHGGWGSINDLQFRPFVTSFVPVINDGFVVPAASPLQERIARLAVESPPVDQPPRVEKIEPPSVPRATSSAERGDISLREIRQSLAREDAAKAQKLQAILDKARRLEATQPRVARYYYRSAQRQAPPAMMKDIETSLLRVERAIAAVPSPP